MNPEQLTAVFLVGGFILLVWLAYLSGSLARAHRRIDWLEQAVARADTEVKCRNENCISRYDHTDRRLTKIEEHLSRAPRFKV